MKGIKYNIIQLILIIYLLFSVFISQYIDNKIFNLIINPLFWICISIYLFVHTNNNHGRFSKIDENMKTMFIITLLFILINFFSGLIFGFSRNPYSNKLIPFLKNFIQIVVVIMGIEYTRSAIINENSNKKIFVIIFTLIFILLEINYPNLYNISSDKESLFKYVSSVILPIIFGNILYTYLTIKGSYKVVYVYRIIIEIIYLLVPILPDFDWFILGIRGIIVPSAIYISFKYIGTHKVKRSNSLGRRKKKNPIFYIPFFSILVIFILFMAGVFIYEPIAILSNSMVPVFYRGDIVIYRKVDDNTLKNLEKNTIIVYSKEGQIIVHRIVDQIYQEKEKYYITKGDANISDDLAPVSKNQIIGIYACSLKYVGYPSVWLSQYFKNEKPKVEIK